MASLRLGSGLLAATSLGRPWPSPPASLIPGRVALPASWPLLALSVDDKDWVKAFNEPVELNASVSRGVCPLSLVTARMELGFGHRGSEVGKVPCSGSVQDPGFLTQVWPLLPGRLHPTSAFLH